MTTDNPTAAGSELTSAGLSFTPHIDVANAGRLLRRVEAHHDQAGWHSHGNMHVYAVYDHQDLVTGRAINHAMRTMGDPVRNSRYTAQPMLASRVFRTAHQEAGLQPTAALRRFAANTAFGNAEYARPEFGDQLEAFRALIRMPGVLGYIACYEAYMARTEPPVRDVLAAPRHLKDVPGSVETRQAMMVDVHDRLHSVTRVRGEAAQLELDVTFVGSIANSLRILMDATMRRSPVDQAGFDDRYPDLEEAARRYAQG